MEVIQEYENWRRVRDAEGTEGWVNQALLSGDRTALAAPWMREKGKDVYVNLRKEPQSSAQIIAKLEPGVIMHIRQCNGDWCEAKTNGVEGWSTRGKSGRLSGRGLQIRPLSAAACFSEVIGRGPNCWMTMPAARQPRSPQVLRSLPLV